MNSQQQCNGATLAMPLLTCVSLKLTVFDINGIRLRQRAVMPCLPLQSVVSVSVRRSTALPDSLYWATCAHESFTIPFTIYAHIIPCATQTAQTERDSPQIAVEWL